MLEINLIGWVFYSADRLYMVHRYVRDSDMVRTMDNNPFAFVHTVCFFLLVCWFVVIATVLFNSARWFSSTICLYAFCRRHCKLIKHWCQFLSSWVTFSGDQLLSRFKRFRLKIDRNGSSKRRKRSHSDLRQKILIILCLNQNGSRLSALGNVAKDDITKPAMWICTK